MAAHARTQQEPDFGQARHRCRRGTRNESECLPDILAAFTVKDTFLWPKILQSRTRSVSVRAYRPASGYYNNNNSD